VTTSMMYLYADSATSYQLLDATFYAKSGNYRTCQYNLVRGVDGDYVGEFLSVVSVWGNSADTITSLLFTQRRDTSWPIPSGTRFIVMGMDNQ